VGSARGRRDEVGAVTKVTVRYGRRDRDWCNEEKEVSGGE